MTFTCNNAGNCCETENCNILLETFNVVTKSQKTTDNNSSNKAYTRCSLNETVPTCQKQRNRLKHFSNITHHKVLHCNIISFKNRNRTDLTYICR